MASSDSSLNYRRIRAPIEHGDVLHLPPAQSWHSLWQDNLETNINNVRFESAALAQVRSSGRAEIAQAAFQHTRQYRDVDLSDRNPNQILMAGHQPTLFHAGVWYKNFVLSSFSKHCKCLPINLVVDNDVCSSTFVNIPGPDNHLQRVAFDASGPAVSFETREIIDSDIFEHFGNTITKSISGFTENPIAQKLWPHILDISHNSKGGANLGFALAAGRHRYEGDLGLQTLELPISALAAVRSFSTFAFEIFARMESFQKIYNETIRAYRSVHKIKNKSHPVPELSTKDKWIETPFWIWDASNPRRRSLYVQLTGESLRLSDLSGINEEFPKNAGPDTLNDLSKEFVVRPKALITTMFSRLIASDMFIHGIGGSKYDQLTDEIAQRFFNVLLPEYLTVTGTFKIQDKVLAISKADITTKKHELREQDFHPENFIDSPDDETSKLISEKRRWIKKKLPQGQRLPRHQAITALNQNLKSHLDSKQRNLVRDIDELTAQKPIAKILNSREFSFCLFDQNLPTELATLSRL